VIDVDVKVDMRELEHGLAAMCSTRTLTEVARRLRKPMRADQRDHARKMEGPDGSWPPRKKRLGRGKAAKKRNRRKLLGRLPGAIKVYARGEVVTAESLAKWAEAHRTGARVGRGAKLPIRDFLWISDGLMTTAAAELQEVALRAFGGG
jgi:hypothetical protein